jgi:O-antigen/teichoic acid export membrane protein
LAIGSILGVLAIILPWEHLIRVANPAVQDEIRQSLIVFAVLFGIYLFTGSMQRIFIGLQHAFMVHATTAIGSLLSLLAIWWATRSAAGIPILLISTFGCQILAGFFLLTLLAHLHLFQFSGICVAIGAERKPVLRAGGLFFVVQIGTMVGWGADSLIVASTLGAGQVAIFSVTQRLFHFVAQPLSMMNAPLWGAYADAHARGDKEFIRRTLKHSMLLTAGITVVVGGLLVVASQTIFEWWTEGAIVVPLSFVLAFFVWTLCSTLNNTFSMAMNGCGLARPQMISVILFVALAIPLKMLLSPNGLSFLVISTIFSYLLAVPLFHFVASTRQINEMLR